MDGQKDPTGRIELFRAIEHGSLYPALHRLGRKGWLSAKWEPAAMRGYVAC
jgi:DNA-binding PadR family transcriptional regulator